MKSRLLSRLDAAIASATLPLQADCLRAERAALLARQGQLDEAHDILIALQARYAAHPHATMSGWLSLVDGLVSYYNDLNRAARDRMLRAYALSGAARDIRLHALAAAWLSHLDYVDLDLDAMARHAAEALRHAGPEHHAAHARACLVAAQAYHFGGRLDLAQPWYARARQHANAEGDETMLSAVMHNMAALLVHESRRIALCGAHDEGVARQALLGAESTGNFDALIGTASLDALVPLLRAQIGSVQGRWADAVALYEAHFSDGLLQGLARMRACLGADLAWCRLQLGQAEQALDDALAAQAAVAHDRDVDDRAAAHSRLAQVFRQLGRTQEAAHHQQRAEADWHTHARDQAQAVAVLDKALAAAPAYCG